MSRTPNKKERQKLLKPIFLVNFMPKRPSARKKKRSFRQSVRDNPSKRLTREERAAALERRKQARKQRKREQKKIEKRKKQQ